MPTTPTDQQLIERLNAGDIAAFDELYLRYKDWSYGLAYRFTRDHTLALDVLQDSYLYFYRKFPGFELTAALKTFLYPVIKHTALNLLKKQRKNRQEEPASLDAAAARVAAKQPELADLEHLLAALSSEHREVILMRFVDDLPQEDIATALHIPLGTVKSRLHHALNKLRNSPLAARYFS